MSGYGKNENLSLFGYLKKAITEKDWLTLGSLVVGILSIILACVCAATGFSKGILAIVIGCADAIPAMLALDRSRNSLAITGAICGFVGAAIGIIYLFYVTI